MKEIFGLMLAFSVVAGCSNGAPDCLDERTRALALEIVKDSMRSTFTQNSKYLENLAGQFGMRLKGNFEDIALSLEDIRTIKHSEGSGSYMCRATLIASRGDESASAPVEYTSEVANGSDHYVEVFGLNEEVQGELIMSILLAK